MVRIVDLPTTGTVDSNTYVPVFQHGKTKKIAATSLGGGGGSVNDQIHTAASKTTPADADELGVVDSAATWSLKRLTFANLKAWIGSLFVSKSGDTINGNLNFSGAARRITGNFSGAPIANRTMFQTSTIDSQTSIGVLPNGSGDAANINVFGNSDPGNSSLAQILTQAGNSVSLRSTVTGSGTYLPLTLHTGNAERLRIDTSGNVLVTSGAFGYGPGSGGTVTQPTSKSTAVTLNKPSGQITMHGASLAAGAAVEFSLNNTSLNAYSWLVVNPTGFTGYSVEVSHFNSPTEVVLRVTNKGVTRADALTIVFRVINGSIS